jgi:hypothetical protein
LEFREEFAEYIVEDVADDGDGGEIFEVIIGQYVFDYAGEEPEGLFLAHLVDQQIGYDVVHALAVEQGGVSDGVGAEDVPEVLLELVCAGEGAGDVFFDGGEEGEGVLGFGQQELFVVAGVFESAVVGVAGDGEEVFVALLFHLHALVYLRQFFPSWVAEVFLLVRE